MTQKKYLFIDRDGTLIVEPEDQQIDSIEKLDFLPGVIPALLQLKAAGYIFVMVSNQDGLGTNSFPQQHFDEPHALMLRILNSQGIFFENTHICPHFSYDNCDCRKPKIGLLLNYLTEQSIYREHSWVIGDRETDLQLANNLGIKGVCLGKDNIATWEDIVKKILQPKRSASLIRKTKETAIQVRINLDDPAIIQISTGIGFLDHMLEQLAKHGGFGMELSVQGDLHIDDHHTVEDSAIAIGEAMRQALGEKMGIGRYGFLLPMDESLAQVAVDLCGRAYFVFNGNFQREKVGELATELVPHFFRSFAEGLKAALHIDVKGENSHHMVEAIFKGVGRALRPALAISSVGLPSTKGVL